MAPNLLTLLGLFCTIASAIIYLPFDTTLTQPMPAWMYLFSVFMAFMYQTLDAVDGKQARRTGSSSPLGQLFDHGVDAACVSFGIVMYLQVIRSGTSAGFYMLYISLTVNTSSGLYSIHFSLDRFLLAVMGRIPYTRVEN